MDDNTYTEYAHTSYRDSTRTVEARHQSIERRNTRRQYAHNGGRW